MSGRLYDVVFGGELLPDADPALVRQRLAALFRIEVSAVERLFTGAPVVIRKAVEEGVATRYQHAMRQAGAVCALREVSPSAGSADPETSSAENEGFAPDLSSAILLPPGTPFPQPPPAHPPQFDFSTLTLAEPGVDLVDPRPAVAAAVPDVSGISLVDGEERKEEG
ncbi:MAG: hypothetical protein RBT81_10520 [Gammaproteobacteria bacterium]|jgi:hypothetical protein|nr:hypothetical protein [Gammaproteobacteria bacterium]